MAEGKPGETLISFESGHYKKVKGVWKGDSVWAHWTKDKGGEVHVNKDKVEYMETFELPVLGETIQKMVMELKGRVASLEARETRTDVERRKK